MKNGNGRTYKVGIVGSYGGLNLGDEAIVQCIIRQLRRSLPVEKTVLSRNTKDTRARHRVERAHERNAARSACRGGAGGASASGGGHTVSTRNADKSCETVNRKGVAEERQHQSQGDTMVKILVGSHCWRYVQSLFSVTFR